MFLKYNKLKFKHRKITISHVITVIPYLEIKIAIMKVTKLSISIFLAIILFNSCSYKPTQKRTVVLSELSNPHEIISDNSHLIISDGIEGTSIFIYGLKDLSIDVQFGGTGDTIGKFIVSGGHEVDMNIRNDTLLISSHWKTSLFTKKGKLIKETPIKEDTYGYSFLGNNYQGSDDITINNIMYYTFNIYDNEFKFKNEITRIAGSNQGEKGIERLVRKYQGITYNEKYYFKGKSEDFEIEIYNSNGIKYGAISHDYERIPVREEHKNSIYKLYREHPLFGQFFEQIKHRFVFPDYLPAIYNFNIADDFIYALTYESDSISSVMYKFGIDGKLSEKLNVPLIWKNATEIFPYTVSGNKLYQLVLSKSEEWELQIFEL